MATRKEKNKNGIAFSAVEHEKFTREPLGLYSLRKYLVSLGYRGFEKRRRSVLSP
jgi:hypothetical protein